MQGNCLTSQKYFAKFRIISTVKDKHPLMPGGVGWAVGMAGVPGLKTAPRQGRRCWCGGSEGGSCSVAALEGQELHGPAAAFLGCFPLVLLSLPASPPPVLRSQGKAWRRAGGSGGHCHRAAGKADSLHHPVANGTCRGAEAPLD